MVKKSLQLRSWAKKYINLVFYKYPADVTCIYLRIKNTLPQLGKLYIKRPENNKAVDKFARNNINLCVHNFRKYKILDMRRYVIEIK